MRRRRKQSGFALLFVFLTAAIIAITLYMEIPRVAFETQRQKEQLLVERGEQYKLAIRRFVQANKNRWPASMDELESFNNRRFLRHRYKDPMTGKDEWRIVHIQNGVLTDSKNQQNKNDQTKNSTPNTFIQEQAGLGSVGANSGTNRGNIALRQRPSDANAANLPGMTVTPTSGDPNNPNATQPGLAGVQATNIQPYPVQPGFPGAGGQAGMPGQTGYPGNVTGVPIGPGLPTNTGIAPQTGGGFIANQPGLGSIGAGGGAVGANGQPVYPGQQLYPGMPGPPVNSHNGGVSPYPVTGGAAGTNPGFGQPGLNPGQQNQAIGLINGILTSPRPGGINGIQGSQGGIQPPGVGGIGGSGVGPAIGDGSAPGFGGSAVGGLSGPGGGVPGQTIGGGMAGVASNLDEDSIMVYNDHTNYSEWEFVFDPTKWHAPPNPNVGTIGSPIGGSGGIGSSIGTPIGGSSPNPGQAGAGGRGQQGGATQMGTNGMSNGQFGGGGLPDIRPGRK